MLREGEAVYFSIDTLTSSTFSKMPLAGKKFIVIDEVNPKEVTAAKTSFIKTIVSGETVFVEVKYESPAELRNCHLIMGGNLKLTFDLVPGKGDDSGIRGRLLVINARSQHTRLPNDKEIRKKLDNEMGAIVQWALGFPDDLMWEVADNVAEITEWLDKKSLDPSFNLAMKIWISEKVRCESDNEVQSGYGSKPVKGSLQLSLLDYCEPHDVPVQKGRSVIQHSLDRCLRELGIGPEQGVTTRASKSGWCYYGLTLDPNFGSKIEFPEPGVVSKLR